MIHLSSIVPVHPAIRAAAAVAVFVLAMPGRSVLGDEFAITNMVTDDQTVNRAPLTDAQLRNPWGLAQGSTGPFWVGGNGSGVSTVYAVDPATNATTKLGLVVAIPGDGSVTGVAANPNASAFNGDRFIFVNEDGTISGWRNALGTAAERLQVADPSNVYKGATVVTIGGNTYLLAANFATGNIDVLKGTPGAPDLLGRFVDPILPAGYAPFDIQNLNGKVYVTYALAGGKDDVPGLGHGFVSSFDLQGNFLGRVASAGTLNSPWGLAIAPASFGSFAGDLLVGNFGDGTISAFDLGTNSFDGQLPGSGGSPLTIDGLWSLLPGNGVSGSTDAIYFTAGPRDERDGLFGRIAAVPEPATGALLVLGGLLLAAGRRLGRRRD